MSSERSRVVLIFAAVAAVAAGGGFYFFKVYQPAQDKQAAQEEVTRWETRFTAVRDCLLGQKPGSQKTSEALAIREMNPDPWNRGACTPLIGKLSRGDEPDTGNKDVEAAWVELDKAAGKAASAFATHIVSSTTLKQDPLPAALDELDAARTALRRAAGMPALEQAGKPLRAATIVPVDDGDVTLKEIVVQTKPSAHGLIVFGKSRKDREVEIALHTGGAPKVAPATGVLRSVPDMSWGAVATADRVQVGTIDDKGVMQAPSDQKVANAQIDAIVGTADNGVVVYNNEKLLVIGRVSRPASAAASGSGSSTSTSTTWEPAVPTTGMQTAIDVDGRAAIVWRDDKQSHGQIVNPLVPESAIDLGDNPTGATCLTNDRAWVSTGTGVLAFGGGKPVVMRANPFFVLMGCTNDAAVLRSLDPRKPFLICTDDCRTVNAPAGAPELATATAVGGKLVAIASHGGVLGVWHEGGAVEFFGLPEVAEPVMAQEWPAMAMTDGKVIDVLARGTKGFVVIRIPAN
ncbi:MAG: hypothetical protein ABJE66_17950 [Deltaproteobacteria bacterium]